jgi:hypothetical protein
MALHALKHRNISEFNWMLKRFVRFVTGFAFAIGERSEINRMLEWSHPRVLFRRCCRVVDHFIHQFDSDRRLQFFSTTYSELQFTLSAVHVRIWCEQNLFRCRRRKRSRSPSCRSQYGRQVVIQTTQQVNLRNQQLNVSP